MLARLPPDPGSGFLFLFLELITAALGGALPREDAQTWFERAIASAPRHMAAYQAMTYFLLPRWHGTPEALFRFVDGAIKRRPDEPAMALILLEAHEWVDADRAQTAARLQEPPLRTRLTAALDKAAAAYPNESKVARSRLQLAEWLQEADVRVAMLERLAALGDRDASGQLAGHYLDGPGKDEVRGLRHLCVRVHTTDDAWAINCFAAILLRLRPLEGMPLDIAAGRFYLERAAKLGNANSVERLCVSGAIARTPR